MSDVVFRVSYEDNIIISIIQRIMRSVDLLQHHVRGVVFPTMTVATINNARRD
jgi:hypothetical protein